MSANGRNYYLMSAQESTGYQIPKGAPDPDMLDAFPIEAFLDAMRVRLNARKAADQEIKVGLLFTDSGKSFTLHLRHGILEIRPQMMVDVPFVWRRRNRYGNGSQPAPKALWVPFWRVI